VGANVNAAGRTDMTKSIVTFCKFANARNETIRHYILGTKIVQFSPTRNGGCKCGAGYHRQTVVKFYGLRWLRVEVSVVANAEMKRRVH
jgi:hypothetical protein